MLLIGMVNSNKFNNYRDADGPDHSGFLDDQYDEVAFIFAMCVITLIIVGIIVYVRCKAKMREKREEERKQKSRADYANLVENHDVQPL